MNPWVACPAADLEQALNFARLWQRRGYRVALLFDDDSLAGRPQACALDEVLVWCDDHIIVPEYGGWPRSVSLLAERVYQRTDVAVFCGTDMDPDPDIDGPTLREQFIDHFDGTCGVMQPTGDGWMDNGASRICGSPFVGIEAWRRLYCGEGPFCVEYFHLFADEELKLVAEREQILWQRKDVSHLHHHWSREGRERPGYLNSAHKAWAPDLSTFKARQAKGFPCAW